MLHKFFKKKNEITIPPVELPNPPSPPPISVIPRLSLDEQKQQRLRRKKLVIDEFGQSVINLKLQHGILTPLPKIAVKPLALAMGI
jgi:hypothetical protein